MKQMKNRRLLASAILLAIPALGHHSAVAEYDLSKTIRLSGAIVKVDFANPHVMIYLDVQNSGGVVTHWRIENSPPSRMKQWDLTKARLTEGAAVTVEANPAKAGAPFAWGRRFTFGDGQEPATVDLGGPANFAIQRTKSTPEK